MSGLGPAAHPVCARPVADAPALCGRTGTSPWTSRRSEVTCTSCLREIERRQAERAHLDAVAVAAAVPILCDYCDAVAAMFIPRSRPADRSFACLDHLKRAGASVGSSPGQARTDDPLPGRDHFLNLDTVAMLARWRAHRAAFGPDPTRRGPVAAHAPARGVVRFHTSSFGFSAHYPARWSGWITGYLGTVPTRLTSFRSSGGRRRFWPPTRSTESRQGRARRWSAWSCSRSLRLS